jgi:predicted SAM-dependent methyltransferase
MAVRLVGRLCRAPRVLVGRIRPALLRRKAARVFRGHSGPLRICLGSGAAPVEGWLNVDLMRGADVRLDLRGPLPVPDGRAELIYSEHFFEHLSLEQGTALFRECRRALGPEGRMRIAMPDLESIVESWQGDWRSQDWLSWPGFEWVDTRTRAINMCFREWEHRYLYDFEELSLRLREAGFPEVVRCSIGESEVPELRGLETRKDSLLVVEAFGAAG